MSTLDVWRSGNELTVIVTGTTTAPVATNFDAGAIVTLRPCHIDHAISGHAAGICNGRHPSDSWWGELPVDRDADQARVGVVIDGTSRTCIVRWEKPPAPQPQASRRDRRPPGRAAVSDPRYQAEAVWKAVA
jgi:hypothetical protein